MRERPAPKSSGKRQLGRPSESSSAETKIAILRGARSAFSRLGYVATTYRELQLRTGYTVATIYHYFPSKIDLYAAVLDDVTSVMYDEWILPGLVGCSTFEEFVDAFFVTVKTMHEAEEDLTLFVLSARVDSQRHPEVASLRQGNNDIRYEMINRIGEAAIRDGILSRRDHSIFVDTFDAITAGLVIEAGDPRRYANALAGFRLLLQSNLFVGRSSRTE
ncbi:MAG: hypothetical protein RJB08_314 [Actinomycetota bacterium]